MATGNADRGAGLISETTRNRYFRSLAAQVQQLREAMERSDNRTVREICHRLRGSAALFGLRELGDACRDVEQACLEGNAEAIVAGFQVIEVIVARSAVPAEAS